MINMGILFKVFGCVFILSASTGIGFSLSRDMQKHLNELEELKHIFYLLRSEMQYTRAAFSEVFEKIGLKTQGIYAEWLLRLNSRLTEKGSGIFEEIWIQSIDEVLFKSMLKADEKEELKNIGKNLDYIESLDLYIEQLEYRIKNTRENYRSKKKICKSMGITGGMFLVILLV